MDNSQGKFVRVMISHDMKFHDISHSHDMKSKYLAGQIFTWIRSKDFANCPVLYENRSIQKFSELAFSEINPCKM